METNQAGVALLGLYVSMSLYHLTYDQLLLYAGPVMAVGALADGKTAPRSSRWLIAGAIVLAASGSCFDRVGELDSLTGEHQRSWFTCSVNRAPIPG